MKGVFKPGDLVMVTTIDHGERKAQARRRVPRVVEWSGRIVIASPMGPGYWIVREADGKISTVPESEIRRARPSARSPTIRAIVGALAASFLLATVAGRHTGMGADIHYHQEHMIYERGP